MAGKVTLILGGARSGKSAYAERLLGSHTQRLYVATAQAGDAEMAARIARHRAARGTGWCTLEAPFALTETLVAEAKADTAILVDCITVWLSNLMLEKRDTDAALVGLIDALDAAEAEIVLVSNEVGMGIVPDNALGRAFRDIAGRANQQLAAIADEVVLVTAGLPLTLKSG